MLLAVDLAVVHLPLHVDVAAHHLQVAGGGGEVELRLPRLGVLVEDPPPEVAPLVNQQPS